MPGSPDYAVGVDEQFFASEETTFGTFVAPVAADGIRIIQSTVTPAQERIIRRDKQGTRSRIGRITGKISCEWSATTYVTPSGVAGTAPDVLLLLENYFGTESVTATSVTYSLLRDQSQSMCLHHICDHFAESLTGAVVDSVTINMSGTEPPTLEFSGFAANYIRTATGSLAASAASGASGLDVTDAQDLYDENSIVKFVDGATTYNNSSSGYRITADPTSDTIAFTPALGADLSVDATCEPFFPTATVAGDPVGPNAGSFTVAGDTLQLTEGNITLSNNFTMRNDIMGQPAAIGFSVNGYREIDFSITGWLREEYPKYIIRNKRFIAQALILILGTGAGTTFTLNLPYAEMDIVPFEIPEEELVSFTLTGNGLGSSGEDETTMVWT